MTHLYLFIRKDLSPRVQAIQCAHATFELGLMLNREHYPVGKTNFVLIGVENERELIQLKRELENDGVRYHLFEEPDYDTGYTALATEPLAGDERGRFAHYQTYEEVAA